MESKHPTKISLVSDTSFADHRIMRCRNYSISFTPENTVFTSDKGSLYVNAEGGSVVMPEDNECELNRVYFGDGYMASFYPNQPVLIRTVTGVYVFATADHFRGYYTYGHNTNILNSSRGVVLKEDDQLYFVSSSSEVVHYDLSAITEDLKFKQESWGLKNVREATARFAVDAKDICDDPKGGVYSLTNKGEVRRLPENKTSLTVKAESAGSHIFFTAIGATEDFVCVAGYMKDNKHNAIQLLTADLSKEIDGPIVAPASCRLSVIKVVMFIQWLLQKEKEEAFLYSAACIVKFSCTRSSRTSFMKDSELCSILSQAVR